jgi:hypothetical protein
LSIELLISPYDETTHEVKTTFFNSEGRVIVILRSYVDLSHIDDLGDATAAVIKHIGTHDFLMDGDTWVNVKQAAGFTVRVSEYKK